MAIHTHKPEDNTPKEVILMGFAHCSCGKPIDLCPCWIATAGEEYEDPEVIPDLDCEICGGSGFVEKKR